MANDLFRGRVVSLALTTQLINRLSMLSRFTTWLDGSPPSRFKAGPGNPDPRARISACKLCTRDNLGRGDLGNAVRCGLDVGGGDDRDDAVVDDARVGRAVDAELGIDDTTVLARQYGAGSDRVIETAYSLLDKSNPLFISLDSLSSFRLGLLDRPNRLSISDPARELGRLYQRRLVVHVAYILGFNNRLPIEVYKINMNAAIQKGVYNS